MPPVNIPHSEALDRLVAGNARYVSGELKHPNLAVAHRNSLADGQSPFAIVLCCSDSRVVPELIFDQGLGDLFVIRVAGNIIDEAVVGSIEYAVGHLGVNLVMVLGHQSCGAVGAAVAGDPTDDCIDELIAAIAPAVERVRDAPGDLLDNAVRSNVHHAIERLIGRSTVVAPRAADGVCKVQPAYYKLADGSVSLLPEA
jgi:carbonic anhydrase